HLGALWRLGRGVVWSIARTSETSSIISTGIPGYSDIFGVLSFPFSFRFSFFFQPWLRCVLGLIGWGFAARQKDVFNEHGNSFIFRRACSSVLVPVNQKPNGSYHFSSYHLHTLQWHL